MLLASSHLVLPLRRYDLCPGLPRRLRLSSHGALQLLREANVLAEINKNILCSMTCGRKQQEE